MHGLGSAPIIDCNEFAAKDGDSVDSPLLQVLVLGTIE